MEARTTGVRLRDGVWRHTFARVMDVVSQLDLCFCVDLTGSMGPFIDAARAQAGRILDALRASPDVDLRVAFVGYRDFGTIELLDVQPFASATAETKRALDAADVRSPAENSDAAEAVFSGLVACLALPWRPGAYRVVVLVGDAPPHGCGADSAPFPDRFETDPTGLSLDDMANRLEENGVFLYALGMVPSNTRNHDDVLVRAFTRLAIGSGGAFYQARTGDAAMEIVETISDRCVTHLDFDRRLLGRLEGGDGAGPDLAQVAKDLDVTMDVVNTGLMRLRQRGLVSDPRARR